MITTQSVTVKYDFDPDYIWTDISGLINESGVEPLTVIVHNKEKSGALGSLRWL